MFKIEIYFYQQSYSLIPNVRPTVFNRQIGENGIFSAPIQDTRLKLSVNIHIIMEHN